MKTQGISQPLCLGSEAVNLGQCVTNYSNYFILDSKHLQGIQFLLLFFVSSTFRSSPSSSPQINSNPGHNNKTKLGFSKSLESFLPPWFSVFPGKH